MKAWMAGITLAMGMQVSAQSPTTWQFSGDEASNPFARLVVHEDLVYAVGEGGLIATTVDGVLWSRLKTPTGADLAGICRCGGQFVAYGDSGVVLTSSDGKAWTRRTVPRNNRIEGAAYSEAGYVVFNILDEVFHSKDGVTWTEQQVEGATYLSDVAYGNGRFILVTSNSGKGWDSPDGITWTTHQSPPLYSLIWADTQFVATPGIMPLLARSKDGISWTTYAGPGGRISGLDKAGSTLLATGEQGMIYTSTDALTWNAIPTGTSEALYTAAPLKDGGMAASGYNYMVSRDRKAWAQRKIGSGFRLSGVGYGNGRYVAVGEWSATFLSGNGGLWTGAAQPAKGHFSNVLHADGRFVAVGASGVHATSEDGDTWTTNTLATDHHLLDVAYGSAGFVAVGSNYPFLNNSSIWGSADGLTWKALAENLAVVLAEVEFGNGRYVAAGYNGALLHSADGSQWTPVSLPGPRRNLLSVAYGGGLFAVVGRNGAIFTSPDGATWTSRSSDTSLNLHSVTHNGRQFVAIGAPKVLCHSTDGAAWTCGTTTVNVGSSIFFGGGRHIMPIGDATWMSDDETVVAGIRGMAAGGPENRLKASISGDRLLLELPQGFRPAATRISIRDLRGASRAHGMLPAEAAVGIPLQGLAPGIYTLIVQDGVLRAATVFRIPLQLNSAGP